MGRSPANPPTILCIDDDTDTLELRQRVLRSAGYAVRTAISGKDGLTSLADDGDVDLVILDYLMPEMDGHRLAEALKSQFPSLPVIAMSAVAIPQKMRDTVDAYVQKGQEVDVLLSIISQTLATAGRSKATGLPNGLNLSGRTVLCAEDDDDQLSARKMLLESFGLNVLVARSGTEAVAIFRNGEPLDAVIVDHYMPGMKGLSAAAEMKRLRPEVPVIVLSGFASLPDETIGVADAWVQKRDIDVFLRELEKVIAQKTARESGA